MSATRYVIRPRADRDLDSQAAYYAAEASPEVGFRFLNAAQETFVILASHPEMGWNPRLRHQDLRGLRLFRVGGFDQILILYQPIAEGIEILRVFHGGQDLNRLLRRSGK